MSVCCEAVEATRMSTEQVRIRVGTAVSLLELAAQVLEDLPPPEAAFPLGDRELYRHLQAAKAAAAWLVGHEAGAGVVHPARGSALGDGRRIYEWSEDETEQHFLAAIRDWSERQ
jgi:hypothetical protein